MRTLWARLAGLFQRERRDRALQDEIQSHLDLLAAEYERRGMSPDEARHAARRAFGAIEPMKERYRDRRGLPWIEDAGRDLRYAARSLARNPGFTTVAVLTLALGIGANAGIFSLIDALFLKPLPVPEPQQLVRLVDGQRDIFTYPEFESIRQSTKTLGSIIVVPPAPSLTSVSSGSTRRRVEVEGEPHFAVVQTVSREYFDVLGVSAAYGRTFDALDTSGSEHVAVISDSYWRRRFGGSLSALGKHLSDGSQTMTVVGIARSGFGGTIVDVPVDVWRSLDQFTADPADPTWTRPAWSLMARLQPGSSEASAAAELTTLLGRSVGVRRIGTGDSAFRTPFKTPVLMLTVLTGLVLLVACGNLANLTLARATVRTRELAVRSAVGASRGRLVRQGVVESLLLAAIGGVVALAVARWTSDALLAFLPNIESARGTLSLALDARLLVFTVVASLASGLLFGLGPALRGSRIASTLPGTASGLRNRSADRSTRNALVATQVAFCVLLSTLSGLCVRTLWNLETLDAGFKREQVLVADVQLPLGRTREENLQLLDDLRRRIAGLPGVRAAAFSQVGQLSGFSIGGNVRIENAPPSEPRTLVSEQRVSYDFLEAMGTPLVDGRSFNERDRASSAHVAIINESFARDLLPGRRALGQRFVVADEAIEIIGIARDSNWDSLREQPVPMYYRPFVQSRGSAFQVRFAIRASGDLGDVAAAFVQLARRWEPRALVDNVVPMTEVVHRSLARERMAAYLSALVALLAALIACIGVYGVLSHQVAQRTREIGIRSALGAGRREVIRLILRQGLVPTTIGIVIGMVGAGAATRYVEALLYGIRPLDPPTYGAVAIGFAAIATLACYVPARRATRVDPVVALRIE